MRKRDAGECTVAAGQEQFANRERTFLGSAPSLGDRVAYVIVKGMKGECSDQKG